MNTETIDTVLQKKEDESPSSLNSEYLQDFQKDYWTPIPITEERRKINEQIRQQGRSPHMYVSPVHRLNNRFNPIYDSYCANRDRIKQ